MAAESSARGLYMLGEFGILAEALRGENRVGVDGFRDFIASRFLRGAHRRIDIFEHRADLRIRISFHCRRHRAALVMSDDEEELHAEVSYGVLDALEREPVIAIPKLLRALASGPLVRRHGHRPEVSGPIGRYALSSAELGVGALERCLRFGNRPMAMRSTTTPAFRDVAADS